MEALRRQTAIAVEQKKLAEELSARRAEENAELKVIAAFLATSLCV